SAVDLTVGGPEDCQSAVYGNSFTQAWTSAEVLGRILRPNQLDEIGDLLEFGGSSQAFECSSWSVEDGVGGIGSADIDLDAILGFLDLVNLRRLDDNAQN
ncbi:MAG: hypothetical protein V3T07_09220, partial [Myxococcota bacterium]